MVAPVVRKILTGKRSFQIAQTDTQTGLTGLSTYTFSTVNVGQYVVGRVIVVAIGTRISEPMSVTIGGVTATKATGVDNGVEAAADIFYVDASSSGSPVTGTSVAVVVNYGSAQTRMGIVVYSILGARASAPGVATSIANQGTENTIAVPNGGAMIVVGYCVTGNPTTYTATNFTTNVNNNLSGTQALVALSSAPGAIYGTPTVTVSNATVGSNAWAFAAWGP